MTPYAIALLERFMSYSAWLALAVTCHPVISLGRRVTLTRGAKWALGLSVFLTSLAVTVEHAVTGTAELTASAARPPAIESAARLSPWLSATWLLMVWTGALLLVLRPDQASTHIWARRSLAIGCLSGGCVCVTHLILAAVTQTPW